MSQDLQELFNRDPLSLSTQDLDVIIGALREMRVAQLQEEAKASSGSGRRVKNQGREPPKAISKEELKNIKVEDLLAGIL